MNHLLKPLRIALLGVFALAAAPAAHAQVNINLAPPSWGPAVSQGQQYYYIPETNGFYDVPARQYVVRRDGRWIRTSNLSGYDTRNFHPVVVDYVGAEPWSRYDEYRNRYPRRGGNPSNGALPPGQAKKQGYRANPSNGGLPPGQAKKQYRDRDDDRNRNGGIIPGVRLPEDRRYDNRRDDDDDDRGKGYGKSKNKGKGKDRD